MIGRGKPGPFGVKTERRFTADWQVETALDASRGTLEVQTTRLCRDKDIPGRCTTAVVDFRPTSAPVCRAILIRIRTICKFVAHCLRTAAALKADLLIVHRAKAVFCFQRGTTLVAQDCTNRTNKLQFVGDFAAGVAHRLGHGGDVSALQQEAFVLFSIGAGDIAKRQCAEHGRGGAGFDEMGVNRG